MIVVVDDSVIIQKQLDYFLKKNGYEGEIVCFESPQEATTFINENIGKIEILYVDYNIGEYNGVELVQKIDSKFDRSKIFLVTANIQESTIQEAKAVGINFVGKPFNEDIIGRTMKTILST